MPENLVKLQEEAARLERIKAIAQKAVYGVQADIVTNNRKIREACAALEAKKK